jgi:tripartite-type tricarboxylate transporter receptor subunit TctC
MKLRRREFLQLTAGAASALFAPQIARAQSYPSRPVRLVVGFTPELGGAALPGSPADFGKLIADETEKWGKVVRAANIKPE